MKDQKELLYGGPKYKSQLKIFERMIVVFDKAIKERELLLNNQISHENKEKIIVESLTILLLLRYILPYQQNRVCL